MSLFSKTKIGDKSDKINQIQKSKMNRFSSAIYKLYELYNFTNYIIILLTSRGLLSNVIIIKINSILKYMHVRNRFNANNNMITGKKWKLWLISFID
jgi:hypothetical protein